MGPNTAKIKFTEIEQLVRLDATGIDYAIHIGAAGCNIVIDDGYTLI